MGAEAVYHAPSIKGVHHRFRDFIVNSIKLEMNVSPVIHIKDYSDGNRGVFQSITLNTSSGHSPCSRTSVHDKTFYIKPAVSGARGGVLVISSII